MKIQHKRIFGFLLCVITAPFLPAQATPDPAAEPDLVLPGMIIRVEDRGLEDFVDLVSGELVLPEPEIEVTLPDSPSALLPEALIQLTPVLAEGQASPLASNPASPGDAVPFYLEGVTGWGWPHHLLGSLSLTLLGTDPGLTMEFAHEGVDGYWDGVNFRPAGSAFFQRQDSLAMKISTDSDGAGWELSSAYREREEGLQQISPDYPTFLRRSIQASGSVILRSWAQHQFYANLDGGYSGFILSGLNPDARSDYEIQARTGYRWIPSGYFKLDAALDYGVQFKDASGPSAFNAQDLKFLLQSLWSLGDNWELEALGGVQVSETGRFFFPLQASVKALYEFWEGKIYGQWFQSSPSYAEVLERFPWADFTTLNNASRPWGAQAGLEFQAHLWDHKLRPQVKVQYRGSQNDWDVGDLNPQTGLLEVLRRSYQSLSSRVGIALQPTGEWTLGGFWTGRWGDLRAGEKIHTLEWFTGFTETSGFWGVDLSLEGDTELSSENLPVTSLLGFFRLSEQLRLEWEGQDLLSLFQTQGRRVYGNYLDTGFLARLMLRIIL